MNEFWVIKDENLNSKKQLFMLKYRFITIVHNLNKLPSKEVKINSIGILSNKEETLKDTFSNNLTIGTLGAHSGDEFLGRTFFYLDGFFENKTLDEIDKIGTHFTFAMLRLIQNYIIELWKIKDHNMYVRDGFLYVYENTISDGVTFKASVSAIPTLSNLNNELSNFTLDELNMASDNFEYKIVDDFYENDYNYKEPTDYHFFKSSKLSRIERSWYFINVARNNGTIPMKVLFYCTALECLFTSSRTELVHRISERVAILLETEHSKRIEVYNLIKKAYDIRSAIVHGSTLKGKSEDISGISEQIDVILRRLINGNFEIFTKNDNEINNFFIERIFEN